MEKGKNKTIYYYVRVLHRNIGFLMVGFVLIYSISGIVLVYRDTDFLKKESQIEKKLLPNMDPSDLGKELKLRNFKVLKIEKEIIYFQNGMYNKENGIVRYSSKELPSWVDKCITLHKAPSQNLIHWVTIIFGILLFFLAVSSFWMFKPETKMFRKGMYWAIFSILIAVLILFFA